MHTLPIEECIPELTSYLNIPIKKKKKLGHIHIPVGVVEDG